MRTIEIFMKQKFPTQNIAQAIRASPDENGAPSNAVQNAWTIHRSSQKNVSI
jgi:hypothetical protein